MLSLAVGQHLAIGKWYCKHDVWAIQRPSLRESAVKMQVGADHQRIPCSLSAHTLSYDLQISSCDELYSLCQEPQMDFLSYALIPVQLETNAMASLMSFEIKFFPDLPIDFFFLEETKVLPWVCHFSLCGELPLFAFPRDFILSFQRATSKACPMCYLSYVCCWEDS